MKRSRVLSAALSKQRSRIVDVALVLLATVILAVGGCRRAAPTRVVVPPTIAAESAAATQPPSPTGGVAGQDAGGAPSPSAVEPSPTLTTTAKSRLVILHTNDNLGETEECG